MNQIWPFQLLLLYNNIRIFVEYLDSNCTLTAHCQTVSVTSKWANIYANNYFTLYVFD